MGNVHVDISVSLDGFVAAAGDSPDVPLGAGGEVLHDWVMNRTALEGSPFTFVTDGVESGLKQAQDLAGDGDVCVMGGADVAQQCLRAFDVLDGAVELRRERVSESAAVTHLSYRVIR